MTKLDQSTINNLLSLKQSKLNKGQLFLLAKAISDTIPLPPADIDSISLYTLTHRNNINHAIDRLSEYTYIDSDVRANIYSLINSIMLWRFNVAYTGLTLFVGDNAAAVTEDISGLLRYVDGVYLLAVGDILPTANWLYATFKELAIATKIQESSKEEVL